MIKHTLSTKHLPWILPVILGSVTVIIGAAIYHATHKPIPTATIREARSLAVDPGKLNDINQIDAKLFGKQPLTNEEWDRYKSYATGTTHVFKEKAARHLCAARGSIHEQEAHDLVRTLIADRDPQIRASALISLHNFDDPSWRDTARQFLSDPDKIPRHIASLMLRQDSKP